MKPLKPRIFVSSTVRDLPNEREAAKRAVESIPAIPVMSEYTMNAVDKPSVQACIDEVKNSDFYILILGGRYGWELDNGISITELEYDTAFKEKKPIFVFNTNYEKEEKQQKFATKTGSQRFWKVVKDAFELNEEIVKSYNQYVEEQHYEKFTSTELLYSNLLEISFPQTLYRASLNIDRDAVIEASWDTEFKLKKNTAQAKVVKAAIYQQGLIPTSDWVLHENTLLTFHDLHDSQNPLNSVIDPGTIDSDPCEDFYLIDEDHLRVFKHLLRRCLDRKLHHMGIKPKGNGIYAYTPDEAFFDKRKVKWHGKKDATRTVFEVKRKTKDPEKIYYCKHFAFKANFHLFNNEWFASFTPEWFISYDGNKESFYGYQQISWLKRNERNAHVFNHLKFIGHQLTADIQTSFLTDHFEYKFLGFKNLHRLTAYPKIDERSWFMNESERTRKLMQAKEKIGLFDV